MRLISLLSLLFPLTVAGAPAPPVRVQVGIASDAGRNAVSVDGVPADSPGLETAVERLLGCPVQRSLGGFRCRERKLIPGLQFSGRLDFAPLVDLLGRPSLDVTIVVPASPLGRVAGLKPQTLGWWPRRTEFSGHVPAGAPPLEYLLGFSWILLAASILPLLPLGLWLVRGPRSLRWLWVFAACLWSAGIGWTGGFSADWFFYNTPSVEGALLRWVSWAPLFLLLVAQATWLGMPGFNRVWPLLAALMILRPRSAHWMTGGEQVLADVLSIAFLLLMGWTMILRGQNSAGLPEQLLVAVQGRLRSLGGFNVLLEGAPPAPSAAVQPKLGRMVTIPMAWLQRLKGPVAEAAILLSCARARSAPMAGVLIGLVAQWVGLVLLSYRLPWCPGLAPLIAYLWFAWCERRWENRIAAAVLSIGERPEILHQALGAMRADWGEERTRRLGLAIDRLAAAVPR